MGVEVLVAIGIPTARNPERDRPMSGRMELLGVFVLVLVVWGTVRLLDDGLRRDRRRHEPGGHRFGSTFVPCAASGGHPVIVDPVTVTVAIQAEAPSCAGESSGRADERHGTTGHGDCEDAESDSSGSWDFDDD